MDFGAASQQAMPPHQRPVDSLAAATDARALNARNACVAVEAFKPAPCVFYVYIETPLVLWRRPDRQEGDASRGQSSYRIRVPEGGLCARKLREQVTQDLIKVKAGVCKLEAQGRTSTRLELQRPVRSPGSQHVSYERVDDSNTIPAWATLRVVKKPVVFRKPIRIWCGEPLACLPDPTKRTPPIQRKSAEDDAADAADAACEICHKAARDPAFLTCCHHHGCNSCVRESLVSAKLAYQPRHHLACPVCKDVKFSLKQGAPPENGPSKRVRFRC